jgi:hypothetical protein
MNPAGKLTILREKSISRMNGICTPTMGCLKEPINMKIRLGCRGRAYDLKLIRLSRMQSTFVRFRCH